MQCAICGNDIPKDKNANAKYCSLKCSRIPQLERFKNRNPRPAGLPTGTTGAISELRVAADLLSKGYNVFRSLSPSCPCDLAIVKDTKLYLVEVKTSYYTPNGKPFCPTPKLNKFDILAMALHDKIIYLPELP